MDLLQRDAAASSVSSKVILMLALLSGSALAQKADLPDVKAGDQWNFAVHYTVPSNTPNRAWVIKSVTPIGVEGTENGEPLMLTRGEFDAFKLLAKGSLRGTSPVNSQYAGETTETYWYAPMARAIVKSVRHNPYLGTTTVELVEFRLQP